MAVLKLHSESLDPFPITISLAYISMVVEAIDLKYKSVVVEVGDYPAVVEAKWLLEADGDPVAECQKGDEREEVGLSHRQIASGD